MCGGDAALCQIILTTCSHATLLLLLLLLLLLHPFNGLFSRTTCVSRHQKGKPLRILLEQEMIGWQWHQLDHMQIIYTTLHTDNHTVYLTTQFLQAGCPSCSPTNSVKALKALAMAALWPPYRAGHYILPRGFFLSSFFFPRLISAARDWMSTILPYMV